MSLRGVLGEVTSMPSSSGGPGPQVSMPRAHQGHPLWSHGWGAFPPEATPRGAPSRALPPHPPPRSCTHTGSRPQGRRWLSEARAPESRR